MRASPNTPPASDRPKTEAVATRLQMFGSRTCGAARSPYGRSSENSLAERLAPLIAGAIFADARAGDSTHHDMLGEHERGPIVEEFRRPR